MQPMFIPLEIRRKRGAVSGRSSKQSRTCTILGKTRKLGHYRFFHVVQPQLTIRYNRRHSGPYETHCESSAIYSRLVLILQNYSRSPFGSSPYCRPLLALCLISDDVFHFLPTHAHVRGFSSHTNSCAAIRRSREQHDVQELATQINVSTRGRRDSSCESHLYDTCRAPESWNVDACLLPNSYQHSPPWSRFGASTAARWTITGSGLNHGALSHRPTSQSITASPLYPSKGHAGFLIWMLLRPKTVAACKTP
jgi:hypothetical protein